MWADENVNDADTTIDNGFDEWQNVTFSSINFTDNGQTNAYSINDTDKVNVIVWTNAGTDWAAVTHRNWYSGSTQDTLIDVDIEMNYWYDSDGSGSGPADSLFWSTKVSVTVPDPNHSWRDDPPKDVGDVITHEIGHMLGTDHYWGNPVDTLNTMYYSSGRRATYRRTLENDDKEFAKWVHPSGSPKSAEVSKREVLVPQALYLQQNYPNPFNPQTHIEFRILEPVNVTLEVFNSLGQKVRTLLSGEDLKAGEHRVLWDSRDDNGKLVSSGVYLYRVSSNKFSISKKMMLNR